MSESAKPAFIATHVERSRYFFLDLTPREDAELVVVCGGREQCTHNYRVSRSTFPYYGLEYVVAGSGTVTLSGQTHEVHAGTVFAYTPRTPHDIRATGKQSLVKYFVDFTGTEAEAKLENMRLLLGEPLSVLSNRWLQPCFDQLLDCGTYSKDSATRLCLQLLDLILEHIKNSSVPQEDNLSQSFETYAACRALIEERYIELHTLREVADTIGIDAAYLSRVFQRFAREKPYRFLIRLKMDHAAQLLTQGSSVGQAGLSVGFDDPFHFSRVFKRTYGLAPSKFVEVSGRGTR